MTATDRPPSAEDVRWERDSLGEVAVPLTARYGAHTARAVANFAVTGVPIGAHRPLVAALAVVKQAAARANRELGVLEADVADAIDRACAEVRSGAHDDQFVVDVLQGGAGTSSNMNANEVIAHRATALLGGRARVDPLDHVNRSQSTNDAYPTAIRLALLDALDSVTTSVDELGTAFAERADRFARVVKTARTQLQDAVPMTVGQEFAAWSAAVTGEAAGLRALESQLLSVNLGGTAVGTKITAPPHFSETAVAHLRELTGRAVVSAPDLLAATWDAGVFLSVSAGLKRTALTVSKVCNDLRLLASGPQNGFGELVLPARQAGSSIMPGKVNPVIPEMVNQVAFSAVGVDAVVGFAVEGGQLQLNAFEPVIIHHLLQIAPWMRNAFLHLARLCVRGIEVDVDRLAAGSATSAGLATALTPALGYARAAEIAKAALDGQGRVRDLAVATGMLAAGEVDDLLDVGRLAGLTDGAMS